MFIKEAYLIVLTTFSREVGISMLDQCKCGYTLKGKQSHSCSMILTFTNASRRFWMVKAAAAKIPDGGSIINMSSVLGFLGEIRGFPPRHSYSAAKGGVSSLTRSIAAEYAKDNIRCNAIAPCFVQTDRKDVPTLCQDNP